MRLVWKLLRQHISLPQFAGFFLANLFGMMVILLGVQLYADIIPIFTQGDSFIKKEYLVVSKPVSTIGSLVGNKGTFSAKEIAELQAQPFCEQIGQFTASHFKVNATVGLSESSSISTEMFFEAVPNSFIDAPLAQWVFDEQSQDLPIIIPRNYLDLYNFGFAQTRGLPKMSENVISLINIRLLLRGNGLRENYNGRVVGFSNRLNTILVPQAFIEWANARYASAETRQPARLIMEVSNPADDRIATYLQRKKYQVEDDKADAGKATYFLKLITLIVLVVGLLISLLSFYILMLSIYLLLQKNSTKLQNLLLIGYSPQKVSFPYQALTLLLNIGVALLALLLLYLAREAYLNSIMILYPTLEVGSVWPALSTLFFLLVIVSLINILSIRRKVNLIWKNRI